MLFALLIVLLGSERTLNLPCDAAKSTAAVFERPSVESPRVEAVECDQEVSIVEEETAHVGWLKVRTKQDHEGFLDSDYAGEPLTEVFRVGPSVSPPQKISGGQPEFTETARQAKLQAPAAVRVSAIIDANGRVRRIKVLKSFGMGLDDSTVEAVRQWKHKPAMKDGEPVAVYVELTITFRPL